MNFSLEVAQGAFLAIVGPSGAGKSTLLSLIAGFERPLAGDIRLDGRSILDLQPVARGVATLFQDHNLFAHLTVGVNVGLGLHPGRRLGVADRKQVDWALNQVGLAGFADRLPGQLSGGERQRVAIARCLLLQRPVLLLDEPFAALGPALRREMLKLIGDLQKERQLTVLMVTHDPNDARLAAKETAFLAEGQIVRCGPTAAILGSSDPAIRAYLGPETPAA